MTPFVGAREGRQAVVLVLAAALFGLALVGIAGGSASAGETARASRTATVTISGFSFKPATVTIARGSRVRVSNASGTAHTATRDGGGFDTGRIKPGKAATVQFNRKGTFAYHCKIHPTMKGKVIVD